MQEELDHFKDDSDKAEKFIELVRKYTEIPELTAAILNEFVDKVIVHEATKPHGRREQQVDIYLNFIGKVTFGEQDAEARQLELEEYLRTKQLSYYQRNREKILAKMAEQRAEAKAAKLAEPPVKTSEELAAEQELKREKRKNYQREYQQERRRKKREQEQVIQEQNSHPAESASASKDEKIA